jgi:hypothetical protein
MKLNTTALLLVLSLAGVPAMVGCDREVSHDEQVKQNPDGSVSKKEQTVTEKPDGSIEKTTEKSKTPPANQ